MSTHNSHIAIIKRLKRANGHLSSIVTMLENDRPCVELAQQLHAVESAINAAKKTLILDHIGECLIHPESTTDNSRQEVSDEFRTIAKYL